MSSIYGEKLKISIFGQSHSKSIGVTLDGFPAGMKLDTDSLRAFLERRAPGRGAYSTSRREEDEPDFISGVCGGITCGAPLTAVIRNTDIHPSDYSGIADVPRPGHADYTAYVKYGGYADPTGGGHFSGRLTAPLCVAGGLCLQLLGYNGITVKAYMTEIGGVSGDEEKMLAAIASAKADGDSVGGVIECIADGAPAGLGDPMFDGMENRISRAVFAVPAIKGIEFGAGFAVARMRGSEDNDPFMIKDGKIVTEGNAHGGILGGITTGMPIIFRAAVKPTPSIAKPQRSISLARMEETVITVHGRHDPCIVPRAVPCIEAACAIAITDALLASDVNIKLG